MKRNGSRRSSSHSNLLTSRKSVLQNCPDLQPVNICHLIERTTKVVVSIQLTCQGQHGAAIIARQRGVDIRNDFRGGAWVIHIRMSCVQQRSHARAQQDTRGSGRAGATREVQCLT